MPKNKNAKHALTYNSLYDFEQGYADALVGYFSNRDDAEAWSGIGVENLAPETVENIRRDCRSFVVNMIESAVDENGSMEVVAGLYDYDLGRHLFLERMETGVGFADLASVDDELPEQLIDAAGDLKPLEFEVCGDRLVRAVVTPLIYLTLDELQKGFADTLVALESEKRSALESDETRVRGPWYGISAHNLSRQSLKTIVEDCEKFVDNVVGEDRIKWRGHFPGITDYNIGRYLCLDRQGAATGLHDLLPQGELLDRVLKAAGHIGRMSVELGDDRRVHIRRQQSWATTPTT